jgi:branched-chain amino acid aminotransferase
MNADEAFCCGTAAVISPIGSITQGDSKKVYGDGSPGKVTTELYDALTGIQNETADDIFGWLHELPQ